jgi:hypothetical protein
MNNRMVLRGSGGAVKWAYHVAATLDSWTMTAEPSGTSLTAKVVSHDTFAASQRPLVLVIPRPTCQWKWVVESLQIVDGTLTAQLGQQE